MRRVKKALLMSTWVAVLFVAFKVTGCATWGSRDYVEPREFYQVNEIGFPMHCTETEDEINCAEPPVEVQKAIMSRWCLSQER